MLSTDRSCMHLQLGLPPEVNLIALVQGAQDLHCAHVHMDSIS